VWSGSLGAEAFELVLLVAFEVSLKPEPSTGVVVVAFPGENVGGHAVQEPPVVGGNHGAAREVQQRVLQRAEGFHVEVISGLVEQQQVAGLLESEREVEPVALPTGKTTERVSADRDL
jgi:hypothetical protein